MSICEDSSEWTWQKAHRMLSIASLHCSKICSTRAFTPRKLSRARIPRDDRSSTATSLLVVSRSLNAANVWVSSYTFYPIPSPNRASIWIPKQSLRALCKLAYRSVCSVFVSFVIVSDIVCLCFGYVGCHVFAHERIRFECTINKCVRECVFAYSQRCASVCSECKHHVIAVAVRRRMQSL